LAIGSGDHRAAGRIAAEGLALGALLSAPVIAALTGVDRLLVILGYEPVLAAEIGHFLAAVVWGVPASLGFAVLRSFLAAAARTRAVMTILILCVPTNAALNWVLIFGHLGAPALGIFGSGCATAINLWLMFSGLALY